MKERIRRAALGALLAGLLVAGLEGAVGLLGVAPPAEAIETADGAWYRSSESLGWEPRPGFHGTVYGAERAFGPDGLLGEDGRQAADPAPRKVLLLGDSRAFGFRTPVGETFGELVEERLAGGGSPAAVINLAVPGYTVVQGEIRVRQDGLALAPSAVVAVFGFNDRRYVNDPAESDGSERFRRLSEQARRRSLLDRLALARLLRGWLAGSPASGVGSGPVDLARLGVRVPADAYASTLHRLLDGAARRSIAPVVLLLPDNPAQTADLRRAAELVAAGDPEAAVPLLERAAASGTVFDDLARLELARALEALGLPDRASRAAISPHTWRSLHGGNPLRPEDIYHRAARRAAAEAGATVVDLTTVLTAEDFLDYCHLSERGHQRVAAHLAPVLERLLRSSP